jgi:hypothetical protein
MINRAASTVAVIALLSLLACVLAPGRIESGDTSCPVRERFFNGECRPECTTTTDCSGGASCVTVDNAGAVCISPNSTSSNDCTYLGSDTECVGVGEYTINSRFGMETQPYTSDPPYADPSLVTPYDDLSFIETPNPYQSDYATTTGCRGDAKWVTAKATTDPQCGQRHTVIRCRRLGTQCMLVSGTTLDAY